MVPSQAPNATSVSPVRRQAWQKVTKVPRITVFFWIIKILTTAMGEATSDYLVSRMNPVLAVLIGFLIFVTALWLQFKASRYIPATYWFAAIGVSIFGTMAADVLHIQFHVPYIASTLLYAAALAVIFIWWYRSEQTLSFHSIYTPRREFFYWATVLATFALGTATGDFSASSLHLGYFSSGIIFAIIFCLPALAYYFFRLNAIFAFWFAYVITRPLGASFADWFSKSTTVGALNYGDGRVSLILTIIIVVFVTYISLTHVDSQTHQSH